MTENVPTIVTLLVGLTVAVVGWLIISAVNTAKTDIGASLSLLGTKVDALTAKDATFEVALTELRVRVTAVEAQLIVLQQTMRRRHTDEETG